LRLSLAEKSGKGNEPPFTLPDAREPGALKKKELKFSADFADKKKVSP
jgi:hypothetical protein